MKWGEYMILTLGSVLLMAAMDGQSQTSADPEAVSRWYAVEAAPDTPRTLGPFGWAKPMVYEEGESWRSLPRLDEGETEGISIGNGSPGEALQQAAAEPPSSGRAEGSLAVHGQWSVPFGHAYGRSITFQGATLVTRSVNWDKLYEPGWGLDVEGDIFFEGRGSSVDAGLGIVLSTDVYGRGRIANVFSGEIVTSNLSMSCLLVGLAIAGGNGPGLYGKGFFGAGPVHYSTVSATTSGLGITQFEAEFVRNTWTIASLIRGEIGYRFGQVVSVLAGFGVRLQAPPNEGTDFNVHSSTFYTYDVNFGVEFSF